MNDEMECVFFLGKLSLLLNGSQGTAMAEWRGVFFENRHTCFVKRCLSRLRHKPNWRVYIEDFWPYAIFHHLP